MSDTWEAISGYDTTNYSDDMVFEVDSSTKKLAVISGQTLIAGEENSQYIKFLMPRYWDGIDISEKTISVLYMLNDEYYGTSEVLGAERTDDSIRFGWVIPSTACCVKGTLLFLIAVTDTDYTLKTQITEVKVIKTIDFDDATPEPTSETWYTDFQTRVESTLSAAENAVEQAQTTLEKAQLYVGAPLVASTADAMTDATRIYVYVGSEDGYTNGNWYYYDGSAWVSGGVYNAVAVTTDTTLSQSGVPADAKATGDAISALNADLTQVETDLANVETDVDLLKNIHSGSLTYAQIQAIVRAGRASEWFSVGDQIEVTWNDGTTDYDCPFDIVAIRDVYTEDSEDAVPGMILQMHYALKDAIQFDQNEAFYVLSEALSAGTYYFTFGTSWGSKDVVSGDSYYFTTTQDYAAGAQFVIGSSSSDASSLPDTYASTWRVRTYASSSDTSPTEVLELTSGTEGTSLGTITSSIKYAESGLNNLQRAGYGYNRWSQSAFRQYLNSSADAGEWWTPQNPFDRAPSQLSSIPGFMAGFDSDFLAILSPVKVTTALNTVSDSEIGTSEDTYDTFFLASLEEEYIVPQLSGVEGDYWPYWQDRLELSSPQAWYSTGTNANHIRYKLGATTTALYCRLRSANRGYAHYAWNVYAAGHVYYSTASNSLPGAAACVIC